MDGVKTKFMTGLIKPSSLGSHVVGSLDRPSMNLKPLSSGRTRQIKYGPFWADGRSGVELA